jgi:hypothetical protein
MIRSMLSGAARGRQTPILFALLLARPSQAPPPRYATEMLACAAFREEVRTDIRSESGSALRQETAGRSGLLIIQAVRSDSGSQVTAWYDSLTIWRQGPEGRIEPDAEGLLGGRWRGTLSAEGRYAGSQVPFIPDEVAEITDLSGVMGEFFPSLAPEVLRAVPDRGSRYRWSVKTRADTTSAVNDTLEVPMRRESEEEGTLTWDRRLGPVQWERTITVTGGIEAKGPIKRGIRSVVTQRIRVTRLPSASCG